MITGIAENKDWGKFGIFFTIFLLVIFLSEVVVIYLLGQETGDSLSRAAASMGTAGVSVMDRVWKWAYKMVGPMLFPLMILTVIEIMAVVKLLKCWRLGYSGDEPQKQYKILSIVEGAAPGFGFLGTCISLIFTMHNMDPNLTQSAMLKVLLDNSSSAFGSTVFGISLAVIAFIFLELFKGFLLKPETEKETNVTSMNVVRKET